MNERMRLDEFTRELGNRLEVFVNMTKQEQAEGADGFVGDRYERRTFDDWMAEFGACEGVMLIARKVAPAMTYGERRKRIGLIERRNPR